MVPASPISSIMCDHYPVPLITTRTWVWVSGSEKDGGKEVFYERQIVWMHECETRKEREWIKNASAYARICVYVSAYVCVHVCECVCRQLTSLCHSIHPVISNYSEPQVFATASPSLLDLICSTPSVNQPLIHCFMGRHDPLSSL